MVLPGERIKEFFTLKLMKNIVTCLYSSFSTHHLWLTFDGLSGAFFFEPHHALIQLIQPITYKAHGQ